MGNVETKNYKKNNFLKGIFEKDINRMIILMFFCLLLYNLAHPATPGLIELRGYNKSISGVFLAVMSTTVFISSPYLGALADNRGMKNIFMFMPLIYGISQVFFGFVDSLPVIFLARIMSGFASGGTYAIAYGYVSQISFKEDRVKNIAKVSSATIIGGAIGQKLGGLVALVDTRYPFGLQFIFGVVVFILIKIFLKEIIKKEKVVSEKKDLNPLSTFKYIRELDKSSKYFCFIMFLANIGIFVYASSLNYFLRYYEKTDSNTIGTYVMFASITAFVGTSFLLGKLVKRYNEMIVYKSVLFIGIIIMGVILFRINNSTVPYIIMAIYTMTYEIIRSLGNSIMAQKNIGKQGKILGVASAVSFLGNAIGSLASGYLLSMNKYFPFIVNIVILGVVFILLIFEPKSKKQKFNK